MIQQKQRPLRVVLYEGPGAQPLTSEAKHSVLATLLDRGYAVTTTRPAAITLPAETEVTLVVLGHFSAENEPPEIRDHELHHVTDWTPENVLRTVEKSRGLRPINQPGQWKPWFPVIDYDRCTNCMQCLSFCLFDVYGVSAEGKIQVQHNDNCKTNCPACSRVCPEVAIMFPKYQNGPINGDVVNSDDLRREKMKVDISSLLGGDIYASLRDRSTAAKSRFSKERSPDKALDERKKCLTKLVDDGFIPADVLASLPSPDEIQRRATEAAAKAQAALAASAPPWPPTH
jgi:Pyruvate/2-oxoacid:ferredoxin oxidoreductase delta subunit